MSSNDTTQGSTVLCANRLDRYWGERNLVIGLFVVKLIGLRLLATLSESEWFSEPSLGPNDELMRFVLV